MNDNKVEKMSSEMWIVHSCSVILEYFFSKGLPNSSLNESRPLKEYRHLDGSTLKE